MGFTDVWVFTKKPSYIQVSGAYLTGSRGNHYDLKKNYKSFLKITF